ncbi:MAG: transcriptional regulator [Hydrococcus sp. Prado102]|jgi:predicted DNA-binding transcriptional regulator YafY|nr:transcriptional regulator [Hydrococcus sp. Prado102]
MPRRKETITLSIPPGSKQQLDAIARRFNIFWGKTPSPSGLIAAIARQELEVGKPFTLSLLQVQSLISAVKALRNIGGFKEARLLIELLFERGNLEFSSRQSLFKEISQSTEIWQKIIEEQIQKKQPFFLLYKINDDIEETFTICWADIRFFEKEFYLVAWCEETTESEEVLALVHNRCFYLNRIINILSIDKTWRDNPDFILVQLQFYRDLVEKYAGKVDDIENWCSNGIRYVTRKVFNTSWLIQEAIAYGENCVIISPDSVRDRIKMKIQLIAKQYHIAQS